MSDDDLLRMWKRLAELLVRRCRSLTGRYDLYEPLRDCAKADAADAAAVAILREELGLPLTTGHFIRTEPMQELDHTKSFVATT